MSVALPSGVNVYHFTRLRSVGGKPLALMENWVRDDITDITEEGLRQLGLYQILRDAGVNFRLASQRIGAMVADPRQARLLHTDAGSALVTMERTAVDDTGRNVETGHHVAGHPAFVKRSGPVHGQIGEHRVGDDVTTTEFVHAPHATQRAAVQPLIAGADQASLRIFASRARRAGARCALPGRTTYSSP